MNFKWWLKYTIKVLLTPSCWIRNHPTSKVWDMRLLNLMEENKWRGNGRYTAYIGKEEIWIEKPPLCVVRTGRHGANTTKQENSPVCNG